MSSYNPRWVERESFAGMHCIEVDEGEPFGANVLMIDNCAIYSSSHPRTAQRLRKHGIRVHTLDMSETEKAEGGITCCSLLFAQ